jgi:hypothetical protein
MRRSSRFHLHAKGCLGAGFQFTHGLSGTMEIHHNAIAHHLRAHEVPIHGSHAGIDGGQHDGGRA